MMILQVFSIDHLRILCTKLIDRKASWICLMRTALPLTHISRSILCMVYNVPVQASAGLQGQLLAQKCPINEVCLNVCWSLSDS